MVEHIEITSLDLRYERLRLKSKTREKILLASIIDRGIHDSLKELNLKGGERVLLDCFKRYRCAKKLHIGIVPYHSFGSDEPLGILKLIRTSNAKPLTILEQAKLIDELQKMHGISNADIADILQKSKSWVSMRSGIIGEMSEYVSKRIFKGDFPVYSFMYTLRQFIRMNSISKKEIDEFVKSVAGKGLSIRDIELLATGFFKGSEDFRQQIQKGNIAWGLNKLKEPAAKKTQCSKAEQKMLRDLELVLRYMQQITFRAGEHSLGNNDFHAQAGLLALGIIKFLDNFTTAVRGLYDRCE